VTIATHEIQKALYAALVAANVCGGRIYDGDQNQDDGDAPWIEIGEWDVQADDTGCDIGVDAVATLHIWDVSPQSKRVQDAADAIRNALHRTALTIAGAACTDVQVASFTSFVDPDEKHRHGVLRVQILVTA
jgi:hypothetical protein